jgi:hypothetical protein
VGTGGDKRSPVGTEIVWRNPKYYPPDQQATATAERPGSADEVLATLRRGHREELRVSLAEYEGHPFVSIRVWAPGQDGRLYPVRGKGVSVRVRELADVADALRLAADRLAEDRPAPARPDRRRDAPQRPAPARVVREFDEFADTDG